MRISTVWNSATRLSRKIWSVCALLRHWAAASRSLEGGMMQDVTAKSKKKWKMSGKSTAIVCLAAVLAIGLLLMSGTLLQGLFVILAAALFVVVLATDLTM